MPTSKRQYESPRLVQYGDLVTLTRGVPYCPNGLAKANGAGDDLASQVPTLANNSPFTCLP